MKKMCTECEKEYEDGVEAEGSKLETRNKKMTKVMSEFKRGKLKAGSKKGPKVKSRKQALAIGYSEAKKANKKNKKGK